MIQSRPWTEAHQSLFKWDFPFTHRGSEADVLRGLWVSLSTSMRSFTMTSAANVPRNTANKNLSR